MKVVEWISDNDTADRDCSIGGLGGWFSEGNRWEDYYDGMSDKLKPYALAIRESGIERGIRYTGHDHQNAEDGVPLFEDGTVGVFSFRAWGDFMAAIWSTEDNKDYSYMDFYC